MKIYHGLNNAERPSWARAADARSLRCTSRSVVANEVVTAAKLLHHALDAGEEFR